MKHVLSRTRSSRGRALSRAACTITMSTSAAFVLSTNQSTALSATLSASVRMIDKVEEQVMLIEGGPNDV